MKKTTKKIVIISSCLMALGAFLCGIGVVFGGSPSLTIDSTGIHSADSSSRPVRLKKTKLDDFSNLQIQIDSFADLQILPSEDEHAYLEYQLDSAFGKPEYKIQNQTLSISLKNNGIHFFNFSLPSKEVDDAYMTLYLPSSRNLNSLKLYNDSGDVFLDTVAAGKASVSLDYGDIIITDSTFNMLAVTVDSGAMELNSVKAADMALKNEYGTSRLNEITCERAKVRIDSGDLYFDADTLNQLDCKIEYGDITLLLPDDLTTYTFDVSAEYGDILLPHHAPSGFRSEDVESFYRTDGDGTHTIDISSESGDVKIEESGFAS